MPAEPPIDTAAREIRARGPRKDHESLRNAYLDLLKLCLCDLAGAATQEVRWTADRRLFYRQLIGEDQLRGRAEGKDWPLDGLSMIGLKRLDDLQACVEAVVETGVEGDLIEAGVWRGGASILIRATLDTLGERERTVWVADSFQGFPEPEQDGIPADAELESHISGIDFLARPLEEVQEYFVRFGCDEGVSFVPGFFEQTLAGLRGRRWSLVRIDADTYTATKAALEALYPGLAAGGYLIVDDYFHPYLPESCRRAVDDFRREHGVTEPIEQVDWNAGRWRRATEPPVPPVTSHPPRAARLAVGRFDARIPSDRELQLGDEITSLQDRVRELGTELEALKGSPFAAVAGWARSRRARAG